MPERAHTHACTCLKHLPVRAHTKCTVSSGYGSVAR